ncbi:hypothetical protein NDI52_11445 [Leptolyngbya sp. PL-A3]|nr:MULTISPECIES: hypothetical protein [unclassified Leptolyngbya]MBD1912713.1 hypothetical protein [Leptolyngbya sp. FACHB-8]MBD2154664.1 hypothetical protein [Leptolyngbya sp. FACHB-16]
MDVEQRPTSISRISLVDAQPNGQKRRSSESPKLLLAHRQGKTTILISHRPRVISRADWIVLLEQGQLRLQGSRESLHAKSGPHLGFLTP